MRSVRTFGLLAGVAAVLVAAVPAAAHAWEINGESFSGTESFSSSGDTFKITIPSLSQTVTCTKEAGSGDISGSSGGNLAISLTSCKSSTPSCVIHEPVELEAQVNLSAVENISYAFLAPPGSSFGTIVITGCLFSGERKVTGETCAELGPPAAELELRFSESIVSKCKASGLLVSGVKAVVDGIAWHLLTGENGEEIWGEASQQPGAPDVGMALVPPGKFKPSETKDVKVADLDGAVNWTLKEVGVTGSFGLKKASNCENKAVNMKKGEVCSVEMTCNEAGTGKFLAKTEYGAGKQEFLTWNQRC